MTYVPTIELETTTSVGLFQGISWHPVTRVVVDVVVTVFVSDTCTQVGVETEEVDHTLHTLQHLEKVRSSKAQDSTSCMTKLY